MITVIKILSFTLLFVMYYVWFLMCKEIYKQPVPESSYSKVFVIIVLCAMPLFATYSVLSLL